MFNGDLNSSTIVYCSLLTDESLEEQYNPNLAPSLKSAKHASGLEMCVWMGNNAM